MTVDGLLSGDELLTLAEEDSRQKQTRLRDLVFGLLDCAAAMFFFLPFFGQSADGVIRAVSLLALTQPAPYLKAAYFAAVIATVAVGVLTLALQGCRQAAWVRSKRALSLVLNGAATLLFIISLQPYAAAFLFLFLIIKALLLIKQR